jgi:tetratricopeptide (TPR) repeat protein
MKHLVFVLLVIAITACSQEREVAPTTRTAEPAEAIDQKLMVSLLQAKNFHHKAKVYMSDGKQDDAIASVREILSLSFPAGAPEAEDVRNDARALLGKLLVGKNELDEAIRVVQEGIASSSRESFFVANLYTVQGEIHEARAATLDGAKATEEKRAAIQSYDKSIQIDTELQKRLVEQPQ